MKYRYLIILLLLSGLVALFPHNASAQQQQQQIYYVYVEPIPDYATSYASNVIYDATKAWADVNPNMKFYKADTESQADVVIQWVRDYGDVNGRAGETIYGKVIQIGLGDSNCLKRWEPYSGNTVTHIAEHELGHFLGFQHSSDPNNIMYPTTKIQYGEIEIDNNVSTNYGWFVPACTQNNVTSFSYGVTTSDPTYGFDVYFVPSKDSLDSWSKGQGFQYYSLDGCYGKNYLSFGGTCTGVAAGSGLFVITHDKSTNPLTTITVKLEETTAVETSSGTSQFSSPPPPSSQGPVLTPSQITGYVKTDQDQYQVSVEQSTQVKISGNVDQAQSGTVVLTISKPDGTSDVVQAYVTSKGDFSVPIILDNNASVGQYQIYASYQNTSFSSTSFVVSSGSSNDSTSNTSSQQPNPISNPTSQVNPTPSENILQVEGTHFSVPYSITGGNVLGITADTGSKSLIIPVHATSSGTFTITMPRVLIDAKNGEQDDQFYVLLDGKESVFSEAKTSVERTLTIQFPSGTEQIEIIGTKVVPEFGQLSGIVMLVAIMGTVFISRKIILKSNYSSI